MKLLAGSSNPSLSSEISKQTKIPLLKVTTGRHPDGHFYAKDMEDIFNKHTVCLVQSTYPDTNAMEFFLLSQYAWSQIPRKLVGVVPYAGYMRQDSPERNEANFAEAMAWLTESNLNDVILVDPHSRKTPESFRTAYVETVSVMPALADFASQQLGVDFVVSPDKGAIRYAETVAKKIGCEFDYFEKVRIDGSTVATTPKQLDASGKTVAIVDDIISTGGTIRSAAAILKKQGARKVYACCAHGVFVNGIESLLDTLDGVFSSDTIESSASRYSAAKAIAEKLV